MKTISITVGLLCFLIILAAFMAANSAYDDGYGRGYMDGYNQKTITHIPAPGLNKSPMAGLMGKERG